MEIIIVYAFFFYQKIIIVYAKGQGGEKEGQEESLEESTRTRLSRYGARCKGTIIFHLLVLIFVFFLS